MKKDSTKKGAAFKKKALKVGTPPASMLAVTANSPKKASKKSKQKDSIRQIYLENREEEIGLFEDSLAEVQQENPSVPGVILGMDFQDFSLGTVFRIILDQEDYIHSKSSYIDPEEEKQILEKFVSQAKEVFGEHYDTYYNHFKKI